MIPIMTMMSYLSSVMLICLPKALYSQEDACQSTKATNRIQDQDVQDEKKYKSHAIGVVPSSP